MQYKSSVFILLVFGILLSSVMTSTGAVSKGQTIRVVQAADNTVSISADLKEIAESSLQSIKNQDEDFLNCGTGINYEYNKPILPYISRFIVIPPQAVVRLNVEAEDVRAVPLDSYPPLCLDSELRPVDFVNADYDIYPQSFAEISSPFIIRGVRMVKLSVNPVRYQKSTNSYLFCDNLRATLEFSDGDPVNPVENPNRQHRSREFLKFLDDFAENSDIISRDHPDDPIHFGDHYLVVTHEGCLEYAAPFIEWRRKTGHDVDILSIPNNISRDSDRIKALIQERYDSYLNEGLDPFDQLLLIGDRSNYAWGVVGPWQLEADRGERIWDGANHADYKYALLEGRDNYPDVGFSRFCAGNQPLMELFVKRTIAYEAEPYVEETDWFTRGGVYSQHWGNDEHRAWRISIHSNVRWARELLRIKGFEDVRFYEDYEYDQSGAVIGPWVRDLMNEKTNLLLGRAETLYWQQIFTGVDVNEVFPVRLVLSGHGEYAAWTSLRSGDGDNLRGPVVSTCNWGGPPTITTTATWLELVNSVVQRGMSYGWGRVSTIANVERYFPNFEFGEGWRAYSHIRTDMDFYGDPGLRVWMGVPQQLSVEYPEVVDENTTVIEVVVTDADDHSPVAGAFVTLYDPVDIPDFADADYADYSDMRIQMLRTGADGKVQFVPGEDFEFRPESTIQLTAFGDQIRPYFGEIEIAIPEFAVDISATIISEVQGNGDENTNPGETYDVSLTIGNSGEADLEAVVMSISASSPYFTILSEDNIEIGDMAAGSEVELQNPVRVQVADNSPDGEIHITGKPVLVTKFFNETGNSKSGIQFDVIAPHLFMSDVVGGFDMPFNDEVYPLDIQITNDGRLDADALNAELISLDSWLTIINPRSEYPAIAVGESSELGGEVFTVQTDELAYPGVTAELLMVLSRDEIIIDSCFISMEVGGERAEAPQKPDNYGYICLDDTDSNWEAAPEHDWVEISLRDDDRDFDGVLIEELTPNTPFDVGNVAVIQLPFDFNFYGQDYDRISVTTNGFICPGNQEVTNPQNWPLDRGMGGGAGMIAPFWDWLMMDNQSGVYYYYNEEEHYVIIEWHRFKQYPDGETDLTFQVILYHPLVYLNDTGDSKILMQYHSIENLEGANETEDNIPFASVGISSPDGFSGISYTFGGEYPVTSAPLANRRTIKFTTSMWEEYQEPPEVIGVVYGTATNAETEAGIFNVNIELSSGQVTQTDENGYFRIPEIPLDSLFDISVSHDGYRDTTFFELQIADSDSLEFNFALQENLKINPEDNIDLYSGFELISIYPQPFNNIATVKFFIEEAGEISFSIFDLKGREVETLLRDYSSAGIKTMKVESSSLVAGLYFLRVDTKLGSVSRKIVYVK